MFRRSGCSGSIATATATAIVTLHYVILLRVYFCLPALGERILLYEIFIQWHDPTQHGYTFIYPCLWDVGGGIGVIATAILRYTILMWVYFCLPTNVDISADVVFNVHTSQEM